MEKTISFRLELELAKAFKIALITKGETAQAVLEKAVKNYLNPEEGNEMSHENCYTGYVSSEFSEAVASGKLRAIGVSSKRPFSGIPSIREQGVDADLANWRGVFTGKEVPAASARVLLDAVRRGVAHDTWSKTIKRNNWDTYWMEGKDFAGFLELEVSMASVMIYLLKLKQA